MRFQKWFSTLLNRTNIIQKSSKDISSYNQNRIDEFLSNYDLSTLEGIQSIPISEARRYPDGGKSIVYMPEQILFRKASEYRSTHRLDLAIACLRKANELCDESYYSYSLSDYMRLVEYLIFAGKEDEASHEEARLKKRFDSNGLLHTTNLRLQELSTPPISGPDLVEVSYVACCCSECAKYRERIYSYYGKDSRFPRFPKFLLEHPDHCGLMWLPFNFECCSLSTVSGKNFRGSSLIKYSNRPFRDERSQEEKSGYEMLLKEKEHERIAALEHEKWCETNKLNHKSYDWVQKNLPNLCPKSFNGYCRMKNSNTANFQKIQAEAISKGFDLLTGQPSKLN